MNNTLAKLSIGQRLVAGFGMIAALLILVLVVSAVMLDRVKASNDALIQERMPRIAATQQLMSDLNDIAIALRNIMLSSEAGDRRQQHDALLRSRAAVGQTLGYLDRALDRPKGRALLARIQHENGMYGVGQEKLIKLVEAGQLDAARTLLASEMRPILVRIKGHAGELIAFQKTLSSQAADEAAAAHAQAYRITWSLGLATLVLATIIAWRISASIVGPVKRALGVAHTVAAGDLSSEIDVSSSDEMGKLLAALKTMNANLAGTVGRVRAGTESIATAAGEVAAGSQDLSSRTEEQASALEQTASSMEQITSTVRQSAEHARQANTLAQSASGTAQQGGAVIKQVVATMEEIRASAGRIGDITSVIDGIAFQTNILALNAAVEAARAGEQGRGFAVVAAEVRNLAQRSATAAREIKELIGASATKVDEGSALVAAAGDTMAAIESSVERVATIIGEITTAALEQSAGIEQINQAIGQMDAVTQQNAALVEQSAAASATMREQAAQLAQAVAIFQLPAQEAGTPQPAPARARQRLRLAA